MATPTIPNGEEYFFPIIYEGNGGGQRVGKFVPFTDNGTIDNSCIFNAGDNPKLARTPSSDGNKRTWTLSFWAKLCNLGTRRFPFSCETDTSNYFKFEFTASNTIDIQDRVTASSNLRLITNRTFKDTSKYYHFMIAVDTTQSTASDRVKFYVDGDQVTSFSTETYPSQDYDTAVNSSSFPNNVGIFDTITSYDGYLAEFNLVDGTALGPSTFGLTDTSTGRWIPKTLSGITYGTNGFRLEFGDSSALGDDTSGNTNDLTATNLASTDQTTDSPTLNFPTLSPLIPNGLTTVSYSEGNLKATFTNNDATESTIPIPSSGKWYFEGYVLGTTFFRDDVQTAIGLRPDGFKAQRDDVNETGFSYGQNGKKIEGDGSSGTASSYGASYSADDIIGVAVDMDSFPATLTFYKNNATQGTAFTFADKTKKRFASVAQRNSSGWILNFGQNSTFFGENVNANDYGNYVGASDGNGVGSFFYTPPTGFLALAQDNLPTTDKGVSGLVWTKNRDATDNHQLYDSSRGKQLVLASDTTSAESTVTDGLQKFLAGGQQIEDSDAINTAGESFVSWNWVANSGTTASNTDGSITSTVQANTTAGFSIVQYTGTGSNTAATIGHGLSSAPDWILLKFVDTTAHWSHFHKSLGNTKRLKFNTDAPQTDSTLWNDTSPTSTVFSVGSSFNQTTVFDYIAYCWHEVEGFSKFGSYTGNGNADGPFIYTGFRPAWVMYKQTNTTNYWAVFDSKRSPHNVMQNRLAPNYNYVENVSTLNQQDFLSNGFKLRGTDTTTNQSGGTYIYMAFAEHPFVGDGTSPVTAR